MSPRPARERGQEEKLLKGCSHIYPEQVAKVPPCSERCPAGTDVRGWIAYVAQRQRMGLSLNEAYEKAWKHLVAYNPLPASLGRVCPLPCEEGCNRREKDQEVGVNSMERFLGDWALEQRCRLPRLDEKSCSEKIAVAGSGPSGLSFAYQMARRGYPVTLFERRPKAGGMLRYGIPSYRLPKEILQAEIDRIVQLGVDLRLESDVGRDVPLGDLRREYEVVFLGIGAQKGRWLDIPGEEGPGVWTGTEYLYRVNCGLTVPLGEKVVVIGGGNTAIDASRAARRGGARVDLIYRRSRREMPAIAAEVEHALLEGVHMEMLAAPVEILRRGGALCGVRVQRMELGEADDSGRRRPVPIPGSESVREATSVIAAVSQEPDWESLEEFSLDGGWLKADALGLVEDGVWAGGDVLSLGIASLAVGQGRKAAAAAHHRLRGSSGAGAEARPARIKKDYFPAKSKAERFFLPTDRWLVEPAAEVDQGITEHQFLQEASRCLSCGLCFGCGHCQMYCNSAAYTPVQEPRPGVYFSLALDMCEGCGKCIEICPCGFLSEREGGYPEGE